MSVMGALKLFTQVGDIVELYDTGDRLSSRLDSKENFEAFYRFLHYGLIIVFFQ